MNWAKTRGDLTNGVYERGLSVIPVPVEPGANEFVCGVWSEDGQKLGQTTRPTTVDQALEEGRRLARSIVKE